MAQVLILNFDEPDGSTELLDEVTGLTPDYLINTVVDTSWFKYGSGSLFVGANGIADGLILYTLPSSNSDDITIHYTLLIDILGTIQTIITAVAGYPGVEVGIDDSDPADPGIFKLYIDYSNVDETITGKLYIDEILAETEYHIAAVVKNQDLMLFVDGLKKATVALGMAAPMAGINLFGVMASDGGILHIDALEITHEALWDDDFTPPTIPPSPTNVPCKSISLTGYPPAYNVYSVPEAEITLAAIVPYRHEDIPLGEITLAAVDPSFGSGPYLVPVGELTLAPVIPAYVWEPVGPNSYKQQTIYQCILTGDADALPDLVLPMSSFQATMRDGDPSYLSCVIPNSIIYIDDIISRTNGDIVVKKGYKSSDGTINVQEICRADYETLQTSRGGRNDSSTISGHKTTTSTAPKTRALTEVSFYGLQTDGKRTYRAAPDNFLCVGDYATFDGETIVVGQISYMVDALLAIMQITEA